MSLLHRSNKNQSKINKHLSLIGKEQIQKKMCRLQLEHLPQIINKKKIRSKTMTTYLNHQALNNKILYRVNIRQKKKKQRKCEMLTLRLLVECINSKSEKPNGQRAKEMKKLIKMKKVLLKFRRNSLKLLTSWMIKHRSKSKWQKSSKMIQEIVKFKDQFLVLDRTSLLYQVAFWVNIMKTFRSEKKRSTNWNRVSLEFMACSIKKVPHIQEAVSTKS